MRLALTKDSDSREATRRFSDRVADYERWRPGYPAQLIDWLRHHCRLEKGDAVADIGSGTGLFTRELLEAGLQVHAVEPNEPMRRVAERAFANKDAFTSCDGRAERTGLKAESMSMVCVAQAFHWFDPVRARAEFARILKPGGHVALIWNVRREDTPFLVAYEAMLRKYAPEYANSGVPAQANEESVRRFFTPSTFERNTFAYSQQFDAEGLRGRMMSSSYTPAAGTAGHEEIVAACNAIFTKHAKQGRITFPYETRVFVGSCNPLPAVESL